MATALRILIALVWLLPIGGAAIGGFVLITGMATATGAPQEAVVAALACACAVIPYCAARGVNEILSMFLKAADKPEAGKAFDDKKPESEYRYASLSIK